MHSLLKPRLEYEILSVVGNVQFLDVHVGVSELGD